MGMLAFKALKSIPTNWFLVNLIVVSVLCVCVWVTIFSTLPTTFLATLGVKTWTGISSLDAELYDLGGAFRGTPPTTP